MNKVQSAYGGTAWPIPGKIEAESYDNGGEGIAYHDSEEENKFNLYRTNEAVDVENTGDAGGGYNVGWMETGEWMEYTVDVQTAGTYTLELRLASGNAGTKSIHVEMDGNDISGTVSFTLNNGWQNYQTFTVTTPALTTGTKVMRVVVDAGEFNLNYVNFILASITSIKGYNNNLGLSTVTVYPNPVKAGGMINLNFDAGNESVYQLRISNNLGQKIYETTLNVSSGKSDNRFSLPDGLVPGYYQLEISSGDGNQAVQKILIQ